MLFSEEVLARIDFYETEHYSAGNEKYSTIVVHWKKKWYEFWKKPSIIQTCCLRESDGEFVSYSPSDEHIELNDQLHEYFDKLAPKPACKLYAIAGGKQ